MSLVNACLAKDRIIREQEQKIERLRTERNEAREAAIWLRIVLTNMTQDEQMVGVYERWPWLRGDD